MAKVKLYNPDDKDSFYMQFGNLLARKRQYTYNKKRIDTRTKEYGNPRIHSGEMGKYKAKINE